MRTKTLLLTAALTAAGALTSMAQVYSINIVGYINLPVLIPTQDSIQEFRVQTSNLGPEWGKFSGGVINLSTKSGTNSLHGETYEYVRNKIFNANDFFLNAVGKSRPPWVQNQFGANAGGPHLMLASRPAVGYHVGHDRRRHG